MARGQTSINMDTFTFDFDFGFGVDRWRVSVELPLLVDEKAEKKISTDIKKNP